MSGPGGKATPGGSQKRDRRTRHLGNVDGDASAVLDSLASLVDALTRRSDQRQSPSSPRPGSVSPPAMPEPDAKKQRRRQLSPEGVRKQGTDFQQQQQQLFGIGRSIGTGGARGTRERARRRRQGYAQLTGIDLPSSPSQATATSGVAQGTLLPSDETDLHLPEVSHVTSHEFAQLKSFPASSGNVTGNVSRHLRNEDSSGDGGAQIVVEQLGRLQIRSQVEEIQPELAAVANDIWEELVRGQWASRVPGKLEQIRSHMVKAQSGELLSHAIIAAFSSSIGVNAGVENSVPPGTSLGLRVVKLVSHLKYQLSVTDSVTKMSTDVCHHLLEAQTWVQHALSEASVDSVSGLPSAIFRLLSAAQAHSVADAATRQVDHASEQLDVANVAAFALAAAAQTSSVDEASVHMHSADALVPAAAEVLMSVAAGVHRHARAAREVLCSVQFRQDLQAEANANDNSKTETMSFGDLVATTADNGDTPYYPSLTQLLADIYLAGLSHSAPQAPMRTAALYEVLIDAALKKLTSSSRASNTADLAALLRASVSNLEFPPFGPEIADPRIVEDAFLEGFSTCFGVSITVTDMSGATRKYPECAIHSEISEDIKFLRRPDGWMILNANMKVFPQNSADVDLAYHPVHRDSLLELALDAIAFHKDDILLTGEIPVLPPELFEPVIARLLRAQALTPGLLAALMFHNPMVIALDLSSSWLIDDLFLIGMRQELEKSLSAEAVISCELQILNLASSCASDVGLSSLFRCPGFARAIQILDLSNTALSDEGLSAVLASSQHALIELYLAGCHVTDVGVAVIIECVPNIAVLDLHDCPLITTNLVRSLRRRLYNAERPLPLLSSLDIRNCPLVSLVEMFSLMGEPTVSAGMISLRATLFFDDSFTPDVERSLCTRLLDARKNNPQCSFDLNSVVTDTVSASSRRHHEDEWAAASQRLSAFVLMPPSTSGESGPVEIVLAPHKIPSRFVTPLLDAHWRPVLDQFETPVESLQVLDISRHALVQCGALSTVLPQFLNLRVLKLVEVFLRDSDVEAIVPLSQLEVLEVSNPTSEEELTSQGLCLLEPMVRLSFTRLSLVKCPMLNDDTIRGLFAPGHSSYIRELDFSQCFNLSGSGFDVAFANCPRLTSFRSDGVPFPGLSKVISVSYSNLIVLSCSSVGADTLAVLTRAIPNLREFSTSCSPDVPGVMLGDAIRQWSHLSVLRVSDYDFSTVMPGKPLIKHPSLEVLHATRSHRVHPSHLSLVGDGCPQLHTVDFSWTELEPSSGSRLAFRESLAYRPRIFHRLFLGPARIRSITWLPRVHPLDPMRRLLLTMGGRLASINV